MRRPLRIGEQHAGDLRVESAEQQAQQIIGVELARRGWTRAQLRERAKGDVEKVRMARRLRKETTVTLKWIAEPLAMGSWNSVAHHLWQPAPRGNDNQPQPNLL